MNSTRKKVLAIGLDAAEPTLIRRLMDQGQMPTLASIVQAGQWVRVEAPAYIGSGSVWPTFITGKVPTAHGLYSEWIWRPEEMSLQRYSGRDLIPFWKGFDEEGVTVGVLDVPFATPVGLARGFEVAEWWAHDSVLRETFSGPNGASAIVKSALPHPLSAHRQAAIKPDDKPALRRLSDDCVEGVRRRCALVQKLIAETTPQFTLMVFPETHHAGHQMWHTVGSNHSIYRGKNFAANQLLTNIYTEIDRQIASLLEAADTETTVTVFSLHGMKAALGSPAFLADLLIAKGFAKLTGWTTQSWKQRPMSLLAGVKKRTPPDVKQIYYKVMPAKTVQQVARPTMLPAYDWEQTRAFSLPTDQYGWIRINLAGREAKGSVPLTQYEDTCDQLDAMLAGLCNVAGEKLVQRVVRPNPGIDHATSHPLPDLVVHWRDAAFAPLLQIDGTEVKAHPVGIKTGQHALDGFCVVNKKVLGLTEQPLLANEMGQFIGAMLRD